MHNLRTIVHTEGDQIAAMLTIAVAGGIVAVLYPSELKSWA